MLAADLTYTLGLSLPRSLALSLSLSRSRSLARSLARSHAGAVSPFYLLSDQALRLTLCVCDSYCLCVRTRVCLIGRPSNCIASSSIFFRTLSITPEWLPVFDDVIPGGTITLKSNNTQSSLPLSMRPCSCSRSIRQRRIRSR